ncbi:Wound-responsive family protein [Trema orientale]|uniref:Wound-responsive family protein n=1 Tax=Trema orientale TaxID=63057 RepID=A0A2P5EJR1_TREOI|nr:Wound-responsive family protein [Trema orientale]
MSLRYASRVLYQAGNRVVQGMKEQISRCESTVRISLRDSSSSKQTRLYTGSVDSGSAFNKAEKNDVGHYKQAEESLRTVMYLSCWGPN